MKLKAVMACVCLSVSLLLGGCNNIKQDTKTETTHTQTEEKAEFNEEASKDIFAMDTYMTVTAYGAKAQEAVDEAEAEIQRLDELLSTGNEESEIAQLNQNKSATLSEDAGYLVERALELNKETDGAFDIAIYPVMEAWGFPTQNYQVPTADTLESLLKLVDASQIIYDEDSRKISFGQEGMKIDLGGNVQALGTKTDGSKWRVAVQSPDDTEDYLGILSVEDKAVITSGGYERYFEQDGKTYHHIIDPKTGYPAENGLTSVTVVSEDGTLADGLSTSLFIMGKDKAIEFWRAHSDEFDIIMLTDEGKLYVTEGIQDDFSTEMEMEIIKK